jgi:hypothetical protein
MLVYRETYIVKRGKMKEAVDMVMKAIKGFAWPHPMRTYSPRISPLSILTWEIEVESLADVEKMLAAWAAHAAKPEFAGLTKGWNDLLESGGAYEIWEVEK